MNLLKKVFSFFKPSMEWAIKNDNYNRVEELLNEGFDPNTIDWQGDSLVKLAIENCRDEKILKLLLSKGANLKDKNDNLILTALKHSKKSIVEYLLSKISVDPNLIDSDGNSLLQLAIVHKQDIIILELLLNLGADIKVIDKNGNTLLHTAVNRNNTSTVEFLISKGIDVNKKNNDQKSPLDIAFEENKSRIFKLLIDKTDGIDNTDDNGSTFLHKAVINCNEEMVNTLLSKGASIEIANSQGSLPIHNAFGAIKISAAYPAIMSSRDEMIGNSYKIFGLLVEKGADIDAPYLEGLSLLSSAVFERNYEMCEFLIDNGANVNFRSSKNDEKSKNFTPIDWAFYNGDEMILKLLFDKGADITKTKVPKEMIIEKFPNINFK